MNNYTIDRFLFLRSLLGQFTIYVSEHEQITEIIEELLNFIIRRKTDHHDWKKKTETLRKEHL